MSKDFMCIHHSGLFQWLVPGMQHVKIWELRMQTSRWLGISIAKILRKRCIWLTLGIGRIIRLAVYAAAAVTKTPRWLGTWLEVCLQGSFTYHTLHR